MNRPYIHSNITIIPGNQNYLERPRIYKSLEQAVQSPLITVVAGTGYGKTHAVYSFLHKQDTITAWLQLSDRDNLGSRFWENFVKTIAFIDAGTAAKLAEAGFPETKRQFERHFKNEYYDSAYSDLKCIFVYDDFHLVNNPSVLGFIERFVSSPMQNVTTILISRNEPNINTVPLLSKGLLAKITEDDLRFSEKEMLDYFSMQDISLTPEDANAIYHDTEGWAFAIHLTSLSLRKGIVSADYARCSMKNNIFKLIEHEVFSVVSDELQKYLIKLSLIEHWTRELLVELASSEALIEEMKTIGSFISYDIYLNSYQMHPLFLEYLNSMQSLLSDEEKQDVYSKAAVWCIKHNLKMDAVSYYEKAGNYDTIIDIAYTLPLMLPKDVAEFLLDILLRAPQSLYERNATSHILYARLLLVLERYTEALDYINSTIERFEALPPSPFKSRGLCGTYNNLGFYGYITSLHTKQYDFYKYFECAHVHYPDSGVIISGPVTTFNTSSYTCMIGSPEKGLKEQFICAVKRSLPFLAVTLNGCMAGYDDLSEAEIAFFQDDLVNTEKFALSALYKARESKQYEIETRSLFYLLRINIASGNYGKIQDVLKQLKSLLTVNDFLNRYVFYDIITGWFYAQTRQVERIPEWLKNDFEASDLNSLIHGMEALVKIKYQLAEKRYTAVLSTLENQTNKYSVNRFLLGKIFINACEAICRYNLGDKDRAVKLLENAYNLSESNSFNLIFIELGRDMRTLISVALKYDSCTIPKAWLEKIYRKAAAYSKKLSTIIEQEKKEDNSKQQSAVLSRREMQILVGLSHGLTRQELADSSALSINTVKSVIKSVYNKLNAVNRADAIRIATNLGILKK